MTDTASLQDAVPETGKGYREQFLAQFNQYLAAQHPIVRGLHVVLKWLAVFCFVLPLIFFVVALYYTFVWATTGSSSSLGEAVYLPTAWVSFGLSMSLLVFPWGLDAMLMRAFPTGAFLIYSYGTIRKPVKFMTGLGAFFAGFGIMCAGAPGAVYMFNLASQALQTLF